MNVINRLGCHQIKRMKEKMQSSVSSCDHLRKNA